MIKITILGKVPKGDSVRENFKDWKQEYIARIKYALPDTSILHGDYIRDDAGSVCVVGHDLWTVKNADLVIVNAEEKVGAGTAQEMLVAKVFTKPLICVLPKNTHHRRSNMVFNGVEIKDWIHPFLEVCSDYIADDLDMAIAWIKTFLSKNHSDAKPVKTLDDVLGTIDSFEKTFPGFVGIYKEQGW